VAQTSSKRRILNIVLVIVSVGFLGLSIAPLLSGLIAPQPNNSSAPLQANKTSEREKIKIQIEGFEAVLKREPKNETALRGLLDLRLKLGELKDAVEPLQTLANAYPEKLEYRMVLAKIRLKLQDRAGAIAEYQKVLTTKPGDLEALQTLVALQMEDKKPEAAIGILEDTIKSAETANKVQPDSVDKPAVQWILGNVYGSLKRYDDAIAIYDQISKENPKDFRPLVGRAQIKRAEGKETEAVALYTEAAKLAPPQFKDKVNELAKSTTTPATTPANPQPPQGVNKSTEPPVPAIPKP